MPKWHLYVPVVCSDADTQYHGVCYMEPISRITEVNGKSSSNLTKSDFKTGDIVKVKYNSKLFTGVVDLSQDKEQLEQRHGQDAGPSSDVTKAVGNEKQQCSSSKEQESPSKLSSTGAEVSSEGRVPLSSSAGRPSPRKRKKAQEGLGKHPLPPSASPKKKRKAPAARSTDVKRGSVIAGSSHSMGQDGSSTSLQLLASPLTSTNAAVHNYLLKAEMKLDSFSERMESFYTRIDLFETRCEQAENERRQSESRMKLALDTALGEIRRVEDTVGASIRRVENAIVESNNKFERAFSIVTKDIEMLRSRQDMIYVKQDVLQSTLAGETPSASRIFRSSSCPSTVPSKPASIWSPAPIMSNQLPQRTPGVESVLQTPTPSGSTLQQPQGFLEELSDISAEEVQSLLSASIVESVEGVSEQDNVNVFGHPSGALSPYYLCLTGTPVSTQSETASQIINSTGISPIVPTDQSQQINFAGRVLSTALIDPRTVIQQNRTLCDLSRVGRLGVLLARWSYFGDDILAVSTLKGKGHYSALNHDKLRSIISFIHAQEPFRRMSVEEFHRNVEPKILRAIGDHCKNRR